MRTQETFLCLALLSAAPLAAQEQEHPRLQAASAAETVEKDWSRAMSLYLGIAEDAELPREVRGEAAARMTRLLRRLGRTEDAQKAAERAAALGVTVVFPVEDQDAERIRALQERARALLDVKPRGQREFPGDVVEQILWIGDPAVPVITSWIDENVEARHFTATWAVTFLWRIGSPQAIDYLAKQLRRDSELAVAAAMSAGWMKGPEALPAVEAGLLSENPEVGLMLFRQLRSRIPAELMLDVGDRVAPELRAELIRGFPTLADDAPMRCASNLRNQFRSAGRSNRPPTASVAKPGVSNKAPAINRHNPSNNSATGGRPWANAVRARAITLSPCCRMRKVPKNAVATASARVGHSPTMPPTTMNRATSVRGTRRSARNTR